MTHIYAWPQAKEENYISLHEASQLKTSLSIYFLGEPDSKISEKKNSEFDLPCATAEKS